MKANDGKARKRLQTQTLSVLLSLPREVRDRIYEEAVLEKQRIDVRPGQLCFSTTNTRSTMQSALQQPALTQTCRQLREETLSMFYTGNTFLLPRPNSSHFAWVIRWLRGIRHEERKWLAKAYCPIDNPKVATSFPMELFLLGGVVSVRASHMEVARERFIKETALTDVKLTLCFQVTFAD